MSSFSEPKTTIFIAIIIITIVIVLGVSIAGLIIATETKSKVADVEKENESMKTQITTVQNGVTNVENEQNSMKTQITTKRIIIDRRGEIDGYALGLYAPGGKVLEGPYIRFLNGQADLAGFIMGSGGSSKGAPTLNSY